MASKFKIVFEKGTPFISLRMRRGVFENRTVRLRKCASDALGLVLAAILIVGCHGDERQRFAMEPTDQSAIVGSRVTLPCRVVGKVGTLQWTKDDFGLGTHRNLSGYERYSMIGSDEEGDYSLDIRNVSLEDDGKYQCQVSSGLDASQEAIRSRYAHLTVLVAPDPPRIIQGAFIDATEGQTVNIECVSMGGKPPAEIIWVNGNQDVIKTKGENKIELLPDGLRSQTRSVLRLKPTKEYHNQTITCQAQNNADRAFRVATVQIEVKYAPKLKLSAKAGQVHGKISEGSEARFLCEVDSNPPPLADGGYKWYINNNLVVGDYTEEMIIFNVSRNHHRAEVKCEVSNSVGTSEKTIKLDVTYPPGFKTRPQSIEAKEGSTVTLHCEVDGQPKPELRWLFSEPGRVAQNRGSDTTLSVKVTPDTAGRYICKAVRDAEKAESEATIYIKAAPTILSNRTQFGSEGDMVDIDCYAKAVPKPFDVRWYYEGKEISAINDSDIAITQDMDLPDGMVKSVLVIRNSKTKHYGTYNCSMTNDFGNANAAIVLKPLKSLPLFIILIGVTSGIIIFSAFIVLVVICHRKRRKTQMSEKPDVTVTTGDMYKGSDRSSNISDLKMQLPQSDGSYDLEYPSSERSDTKHPAGLPLAGPVQLPTIRDDTLLKYRYSNDYSDPSYTDTYFKGPVGYVYDYPQGYPPPPHLRVQSPTLLDVPPSNRSLQGSLTRSIDTASTLPLSGGGSQNNSLQRAKSPDESDAINSLGLPVGSDTPPTPVYAQPNVKTSVDLRYAATYGNPYLRNSSLGYGSQVHTAKPAATPAPPPYSAVRSSVVLPSGNGNQSSQATHV
ncbi:irregular chiasm C-roughest protein-like isoform X1 [Plodia interpunctella]|uniref:irregular chiasm C-roughest protein-like isoform X1 n=1 Tax=Plodia interpunctella TaxID=58824 RepID=UPI002367D5AB|nr:irregular chiasm C-roughest protein-like isoform X1 [Plodia interpunctella]XP_053620745.1 irregular chiasm C-roughest protein-like isoform X1 [Plodia interpunctella]